MSQLAQTDDLGGLTEPEAQLPQDLVDARHAELLKY